jgi:hypothetical protein
MSVNAISDLQPLDFQKKFSLFNSMQTGIIGFKEGWGE